MQLDDLIAGIKVESISGDTLCQITDIAYDSRKVSKGCLFVAVPGTVTDGARYILSAVNNGAVAIVVEKDTELPEGITKILVKNCRSALADISAAFFGYPTKQLRIIGITGTNGKTTSAFFIDSILRKAHKKTAMIGTVDMRIGEKTFPSSMTTPESYDLSKFFRLCVDEGVEYVTMEVSSHSLAMKRVRSIEFDRAIYTNLTHDHLDFHKTLEAYLDAKLNLFRNSEKI